VSLVGAGPGDPELLTLKALRLLQNADVILYDRLVSAEILALANPGAKFVFVGKSPGQQEEVQEEIYRLFLSYREVANSIVRLKCGDPMVFARGGEEMEFLVEKGFDVEVVPGVSSATSALTLAGIPLTYRGSAASFTVVAGHRQNFLATDWSHYRHIDTLIVLMGVENRELIAQSLMDAGRTASTPAAFVERASTGRERVVEATLGAIAAGEVTVESPAVFVVGDVVRHRIATGMNETREAYAA
jgi:uroporphyrin-III C-methyltransferase